MTIQHASCIKLDSAGALRAAPFWQHVADAGDFPGYHGGRFTFDRAVFDNVVRRFRESPDYRVGADGVGIAPVRPWDVAHLSETAASNPAAHAAVGWVVELEVREGASGPALWARTVWSESMRQQILAGAFRFASVVVDFGAVDPRTAEPLGPVLLSIAATNAPFIQGLAPLVAASRVPSSAPRVAAARVVRIGRDVSANSPAARKLVAALSQSATQRDSNPDAAGDHAPPTPAERELLAIGKAQARSASAPPVARLDATKAPGRNALERALHHMREAVPGFGALGFDDQYERAVMALRLGAVRA